MYRLSRGTATGGGTTRESNQRLALAWQSFEWESSPKHNGKGKGESQGQAASEGDSTAAGVPLLDAAIVGETKFLFFGVCYRGVWWSVDELMR